MKPGFGELFGEPIPAYFTLLLVGFAVATWLGVRYAKRAGFDHEAVIDLGLYSLIAGLVGSRLLHVIADGYFWDYVHLCTDPSQVAWRITPSECRSAEGVWDAAANVCRPAERDCFAWAAFWRGGLTYYGGLVAGIAWGLYFVRKEKLPVLDVVDMAGLVIPVGLFFGRLGCFFGGCCFGSPTDGPFGVSFPAWSPASESQWREHLLASPSLPSLPVLPMQLFEAAGCLAIAVIGHFVVHPRRRFHGAVMAFFLLSYAALRFTLEFFRADDRGGFAFLSTSQWISLAVVILVIPITIHLRKRATSALVSSESPSP